MPVLFVINNGFVKSPPAALRGILRRCSVPIVRLTPAGFARLAAGRPFDFVELKEGIHSDAVCRPIKRPPWRLAGAFYCAVPLMTF